MPVPLWRCLGPNESNDAEPAQIFPDGSSFLARTVHVGRLGAGSDPPPWRRQRLARASATTARVPCVDGSPCPKYSVCASMSSILASDSYAWSVDVFAALGGTCGPVAAEDVEVVHGVSDEQGIVERGVEDTVAIGVAGGVNRAQPSRHVELVAVVEGDHLRHLGLLGGPVGDHVAQRAAALCVPEHREDRQRRPFGLLGLALAGALAVRPVDVDRDPAGPLQLAGESDVVGVGVREDDRLDVVDRAAHFGKRRLEGVAVAAHACVDERQLAVLFERVEMHELRSQRADHRGTTLSSAGGETAEQKSRSQEQVPGITGGPSKPMLRAAE